MQNAFKKLMEHLNELGYHHPRTARTHSNALSKFMLDDLIINCPDLKQDFLDGTVCYDLDVNVSTDDSDHDIDFVIGSPIEKPTTPGVNQNKLKPGSFRIVIEHKSVITAHRNMKNRLRDMKEFAQHAFEYRGDIIIGGTMLVGTSLQYLSVESIDRILDALGETDKSNYWRSLMCKNNQELVDKFGDTKALTTNRSKDPHKSFQLYLNEIPMRQSTDVMGYDAFVVQPVQIDNIGPCRLHDELFGPRRDIMTYETFINAIKTTYQTRWG